MARTKIRRNTRRAGQGSVYQRQDGRWGWAITYGYNENGNPKRYQGICKTQAEAADALNEVITRQRLGVPVTDEKQTLAEYLGFWLKEAVVGKKAPKTVRFYEQMIRLYIVPELGHLQLGKLTPQHVQAFLNRKGTERRTATRRGPDGKQRTVELDPLTPQSLGHIRATLRAALNMAWKWNLIRENPALKVTLPPAKRKDPVYLTPEEAESLLTASKDHYLGNLIRLTLHTGLRLGEATGLTWQEVDTEKREASVRQQLQRVDGKLILRELKTGNSRRTLPLTVDATEALKDQRVNQLLWSSVEVEDFNSLGLCFTTPAGRPLDPKLVDKHLKAFARRAEIDKPVSFHKLRHTAGTHLVANGVPLNVVKEILGHSQIAITANLYAHAVPAAHRTAFDVLEQAYRAKQT